MTGPLRTRSQVDSSQRATALLPNKDENTPAESQDSLCQFIDTISVRIESEHNVNAVPRPLRALGAIFAATQQS